MNDMYAFVVTDGEYSFVHVALGLVDAFTTGGTFTLDFIKSNLQDFGEKVALRMIDEGIDPTSETIYGGSFTFQNWQPGLFGVDLTLPNKVVPYIAARKRVSVATPVEAGNLVRFRDLNGNGTENWSPDSNSVIGTGGWQVFQHLFSGGNGVIYGVQGENLLWFQEHDGIWAPNSGNVIGAGGWQVFQHLFSGGNGVIYGVQGENLLYFKQADQNGGDVGGGHVIGTGGWQIFSHLFSGGKGVIYGTK